jgi:hypothetical protein
VPIEIAPIFVLLFEIIVILLELQPTERLLPFSFAYLWQQKFLAQRRQHEFLHFLC